MRRCDKEKSPFSLVATQIPTMVINVRAITMEIFFFGQNKEVFNFIPSRQQIGYRKF